MIARHQDWPRRLEEALRVANMQPVTYGHVDCCMFVANIVLAITGHDPAHDLRGKYRSDRGACVLMRSRFGGGIEATVSSLAERMGLEEVPVSFAQRGDVVLVGDEKIGAGVINMTGVEIAVFPGRVLHLPISHAARAWRV